jgi:predicted XRE-type DNA-binding protein
MVVRGRSLHLPGELGPNAKLTARDVAAIRSMIAAKIPQKRIAEKFGVKQSTISHINTGKTWYETN